MVEGGERLPLWGLCADGNAAQDDALGTQLNPDLM